MRYSIIHLIFIVTCGCLVHACSENGSVYQISQVRIVSEASRKMPPALSTAARMGMELMAPSSSQSETAKDNSAVMVEAPRQSKFRDISFLRWVAPDTWHKGEDKPMRLATYIVNDGPDAECVLSVLSGDAGGVMPNLNRWRGQLGLPPLGEKERNELIPMKLLGAEAVYMECSGNTLSVDGEASSARTLLGVVCPLAEYTLFVKMTGPMVIIEREKAHFMAFINSMSFEEPVAQ